MDRREKRALREREIIEQSVHLFSTQGFLGVRMSDLAKQTQYSMGTLYSHFESKEDLLLASAQALVEEHQNLFIQVRKETIPAIEQMITLVQGVWLVAIRFPELIELKNLSLMPSIWKRATEQRVIQYEALHQDLAQRFRVMALEAIRESFERDEAIEGEQEIELADDMTHGLWGLSVGLSAIVQSGYAAQCEGKQDEEEVARFFATNYINFLKGYGWRCDDPEQVFARCSANAQRHLNQTYWFSTRAWNRGAST